MPGRRTLRKSTRNKRNSLRRTSRNSLRYKRNKRSKDKALDKNHGKVEVGYSDGEARQKADKHEARN